MKKRRRYSHKNQGMAVARSRAILSAPLLLTCRSLLEKLCDVLGAVLPPSSLHRPRARPTRDVHHPTENAAAGLQRSVLHCQF
jgi:hypothetical protein